MIRIKRSKAFLIPFSVLLILIGIILIVLKYVYFNYLENINDIKIEEFFNTELVVTENEIITQETPQITSKPSYSYNYIAVLEIPVISLKRGLVSPDSYYNKVNYNIQIINRSNMPDIVNGNLILASHRGTSKVAFFNDLYKLNISDKIYIYYKGYKYEYSIDNIYDTQKDGNIEIYRNKNKTTLTLITCKKNIKDKQVVYIAYLTNKELYYWIAIIVKYLLW